VVETWDTQPVEVAPEAEAKIIFADGSEKAVEVGANFAETVIEAAREKGYGKFRVILGGTVITPSSAPETVEPGEIRLVPHDKMA